MKIRMHTEFDTELPPEGVVAALTEFDDARPTLWPNLDPEKYRVHCVDDGTAVVTEGNRSPDIWARERYDWSRPGRVRWTVEESNTWAPGSYVEAAVADTDRGSHVSLDWEREPARPAGYLIAGMVKAFPDRVFARDIKESLDKAAKDMRFNSRR